MLPKSVKSIVYILQSILASIHEFWGLSMQYSQWPGWPRLQQPGGKERDVRGGGDASARAFNGPPNALQEPEEEVQVLGLRELTRIIHLSQCSNPIVHYPSRRMNSSPIPCAPASITSWKWPRTGVSCWIGCCSTRSRTCRRRRATMTLTRPMMMCPCPRST